MVWAPALRQRRTAWYRASAGASAGFAGGVMLTASLTDLLPEALDFYAAYLPPLGSGGAAVALLAMVLSLLSPWLALLVALCGMAVSYTQACGLLSAVTGRSDAQLLSVKMLLVALALALTLIVGGLVGGLLLRGVTQRVMVLLNSVGSLI